MSVIVIGTLNNEQFVLGIGKDWDTAETIASIEAAPNEVVEFVEVNKTLTVDQNLLTRKLIEDFTNSQEV